MNTAASSLMLHFEQLESYFTAAWRKTRSAGSALYRTFEPSLFYSFIVSLHLKRVKVTCLSLIIFVIKMVLTNLSKTVKTEMILKKKIN